MTRLRQMLRQKFGHLRPKEIRHHQDNQDRVTSYEPYFTQSTPNGRSLSGFNMMATLFVSPRLASYTKQKTIPKLSAPKIMLGK